MTTSSTTFSGPMFKNPILWKKVYTALTGKPLILLFCQKLSVYTEKQINL